MTEGTKHGAGMHGSTVCWDVLKEGAIQWPKQGFGTGGGGEGGGVHGKNCLAPASGKSARALLASVDDILGLSLSSSWYCGYNH